MVSSQDSKLLENEINCRPCSRNALRYSTFLGTTRPTHHFARCRDSRVCHDDAAGQIKSHVTLFATNCRPRFRWCQKRFQHAQEAQDRDNFTDEYGAQSIEPPSSHASQANVELSSTTESFTDTVIRESGSTVYDRLFRTISRFLPYAAPSTRLLQPEQGRHEHSLDHKSRSLIIELFNEEYGINCTRTFPIEAEFSETLEPLFSGLMEQYAFEIQAQLESTGAIDLPTKSWDGNKVRQLLGLEKLVPRFTLLEVGGENETNAGLWQVQMYAGADPIGEPQVWLDQSTAGRLARHACDLELARCARKEGHDLDEIFAQWNQRVKSSKKKKSHDPELAKTKNETKVYTATFSLECLSSILDTLQQAHLNGLPGEVKLEPFKPLQPFVSSNVSTSNDEVYTQRAETLTAPTLNPNLEEIRAHRNKLPIREKKTSDQIWNLIEDNDVVMIVSETGSGKTTQLPQILMERSKHAAKVAGKSAPCHIICTQPRRIAATSVASRVAQEQDTYLGGTVGYSVRFDHKIPTSRNSITYSTAGVLLKSLQIDADQILDKNSHLLIDEVHERDLTVDLLLTVLRDLQRRRFAVGQSFPKIVLMSATMRSADFENYFSESNAQVRKSRVASITIPGRTFPVTEHTLDGIVPLFVDKYANNSGFMTLLRESREYLEEEDRFAAQWKQEVHPQPASDVAIPGIQAAIDERIDLSDTIRDAMIPYKLMVATIVHALTVDKYGDVLVFLPGMKEIEMLAECLQSNVAFDLDFNNSDKVRIFKLHSSLHETNHQVFDPVPEGCRRVILATNIAQTSITLPDVVHVVDCGKQREMVYDPVLRRSEFVLRWIDKATSIQRKGRSGRIRNGHYWAMFTDTRFDSMPKKANPDILISDLTGPSLILKSLSNGTKLQSFFARTLDPPQPSRVAACVRELQEMGMLTDKEDITPLGQFCAEFPLHPAKARGLLLGKLFKCLGSMMIVASHDANMPLVDAATARRDKLHANLEFAGIADDDRYAFISAFREYDRAVQTNSAKEVADLERKHVKRDVYRTMLSVGHQICGILAEYGVVKMNLGGDDADILREQSVFHQLPASYNNNGWHTNLFKAIALTVVDTNLSVWDEKEQAWLAKDTKCVLRPFGVNTMQGLKMAGRAPFRKSGEILAFSEMTRNIIASPRPFLKETSNITPLMAMLFGGPIALIDNDTIEIDGWLRYKVVVKSPTGVDDGSNTAITSPAVLIYEFRKAIDRFLTLAFSDLRSVKWLPHRVRKTTSYNQMFAPNPLRNTMVHGLVRILNQDAQHWDEEVYLTERE